MARVCETKRLNMPNGAFHDVFASDLAAARLVILVRNDACHTLSSTGIRARGYAILHATRCSDSDLHASCPRCYVVHFFRLSTMLCAARVCSAVFRNAYVAPLHAEGNLPSMLPVVFAAGDGSGRLRERAKAAPCCGLLGEGGFGSGASCHGEDLAAVTRALQTAWSL
jgi:hypothetical protein